jgi:hypothetical protein
MTTNSDRAPASSAVAYGPARRSPFKYVPGFLYILALYIAGSFIIPDPRTSWELWDGYHISWVEVLLVAAAMMAIAEQLKVSHPGVDNTIEAILMADHRRRSGATFCSWGSRRQIPRHLQQH